MAADAQPLLGRRVVVTRAPEQAAELTERLKALGAEVLLMPAVSYSPPEDSAPLDQALAALAGFDWIVFTSQNAARFLAQRAMELGVPREDLERPRAAAVGAATAEAARQAGFRVEHVATNSTGAGLARDLAAAVAGRRVLLPRSDRAREEVCAALRAAGAEVADVVAYRTRPAPREGDAIVELVRRGEVDVVSFASPSAFHHLADEIGAPAMRQLCARALLAAIGATTAAAIRAAGYGVAIESAEPSAASFAAAIGNHFARTLPSGASGR